MNRLGLGEGCSEVGDRLQRRGDPDPVPVGVEDLQAVVGQLPRRPEVLGRAN